MSGRKPRILHRISPVLFGSIANIERMETFVYQIRSAKGVHLKHVYQELIMLVEEHKVADDSTIMQAVPAGDCVLLTTNNVKLVSALKKDSDFILC